MKAISLWQPWGSLVARGLKRTETRSWPTSYRGPLAIHAAKRWTRAEDEAWQRFWVLFGPERFPALWLRTTHDERTVRDRPPLGAVVAIAELVEVYMFGSDPRQHEVAERDPTGTIVGRHVVEVDDDDVECGDFTSGRWGWRLENVRALATPYELRGRQGLWTLDEDEERAVRAAVRP